MSTARLARLLVSLTAVAVYTIAWPVSSSLQVAVAQQNAVTVTSVQPCTGGFAGMYPCANVDLLSFMSKADLGIAEGSLNDVWGWTDSETGNEYALVGLSSGTAFVDITDPEVPLLLGTLPTQSASSSWRDIKVYADHAFVVSEASGHGVQVFDLKELRNAFVKPLTYSPAAVYTGVGSSHNIFVNEDSGFAYAVGSRGGDFGNCGPGLHMVDVRIPDEPTFAGCFAHAGTGRAGSGYSHDVQCVIYDGPDTEHTGKEICFGSNESAISIADVTDKQAPFAISLATYPIAQNTYVHQGWLTEDHQYFLQNDELDERNGLVARTTTRIWDVSDLESPFLLTSYEGPTGAIDHNLYVLGNWVYMANYQSGLRVVDLTDIMNLREIAFFDTYPAADAAGFSGAWSTYPYFRSGSVLISSIEEGLFVVRPPLNETNVDDEDPNGPSSSVSIFPNPFADVALAAIRLSEPDEIRATVYDVLGREVIEVGPMRLPQGVTRDIRIDASSLPAGRYILRVTGSSMAVTRLMTIVK